MKTFNISQKLKQATYAFIVTHLLKKHEKKPLARLFAELNHNHDGNLNKEEVQNAFEIYFGKKIDEDEMQKIFNRIDVSGSGEIEFSEFLLACIPEKVLLSNENLAIVFKLFDEDGSGSISSEEIKDVFTKYG